MTKQSNGEANEEAELVQLRESLRKSSARVAELGEQIRQARRELELRESAIEQLEAERVGTEPGSRVYELRRDLTALQVRLDRMHSSLPIRIYDRLRGRREAKNLRRTAAGIARRGPREPRCPRGW